MKNKNTTKKLYDCYANLYDLTKDSHDKERFVTVSVIKDDNGFALNLHGRNLLRDSSADGAIQELVRTYSKPSINMILDELGYIPERFLGNDLEEFVYWRRSFTKRVQDVLLHRSSWDSERNDEYLDDNED